MRRRYNGIALIVVALPAVLTGCVTMAGKRDNMATSRLQSETTPGGSPRREAPELPPTETARVCLATADALYKAGQDREAILLYEKARATDPSSRHVSRRLAVLYDRQGMHQKSREEYDRALTLYPKDPNILNDLGYSLFVRGMLDEAELRLSEAVAADPNHKRAWINLALVLGHKGRHRDSLDAFQRAVSRAQAHANLGFIYTTQGKRQEAIQAYRQALALEPDLQLAHAALARLEGAANGQPEAPSVRKEPGMLPGGIEVGGPVSEPVRPKASSIPTMSSAPVRPTPAASGARGPAGTPTTRPGQGG